jgi:hypothetical protein
VTAKGPKAKLRIIVPGAGQLKVSGKGLKAAKKRVAKAGSVTISVALRPGANRTRMSKGRFRTWARIVFESAAGDLSVTKAVLTFQGPSKKGGK